MSFTQADFTPEELVEFRILMKYADEGYKNRHSMVDLNRLSTMGPYLQPTKHNERMSPCLEVDRNSLDGSNETDATGLNCGPTSENGAAGPCTSARFGFRRGRLRKFIRSLVALINKRPSVK